VPASAIGHVPGIGLRPGKARPARPQRRGFSSPPATAALAGTCRVPAGVRPSRISRVWTPMAGMDRYAGRPTTAAAAGRGRGAHRPGRRAGRLRERPQAGPAVPALQQQAAGAAGHGEQAGAQ